MPGQQQGIAHILCLLDDLPDPGARELTVGPPDAPREIFVVRRGEALYGYVNRCPHRGTTLNWLPGQFLNAEGTLLQCATHGALFRVEDGLCVAGPCVGRHLEPVPVVLHDGQVTL